MRNNDMSKPYYLTEDADKKRVGHPWGEMHNAECQQTQQYQRDEGFADHHGKNAPSVPAAQTEILSPQGFGG